MGTTCSDCGVQLVTAARCRVCRQRRNANVRYFYSEAATRVRMQGRSNAIRWTPCLHCGDVLVDQRRRKFCSAVCFGLSRRSGRPIRPHDIKVRDAPGLTVRQMRTLLHEWVAAGELCTYCDDDADTVDHVVALANGGTNYRENLTPACRPCNARKGARILVDSV